MNCLRLGVGQPSSCCSEKAMISIEALRCRLPHMAPCQTAAEECSCFRHAEAIQHLTARPDVQYMQITWVYATARSARPVRLMRVHLQHMWWLGVLHARHHNTEHVMSAAATPERKPIENDPCLAGLPGEAEANAVAWQLASCIDTCSWKPAYRKQGLSMLGGADARG